MSTDAFLKSVKKFLDKGVRIMLLNNRSRSPPLVLLLLLFLLTSFADGLPIKVVISQSTISIHSHIGRLRHFHHFGNVLNLAMRSVDNPKISL